VNAEKDSAGGLELNPWDVGRLTITKDCKILGVALEADSGNELFHQLGQLIDKVGVAVTRIQASLPKPQDETSKCFMFIEMKNSKVSAKEIEEFLKQQSFVKSVKIIESSKHGIVDDIHHFPTTALNERAIILERNTYSAIIKDVRKLFGTAAEAFLYYIGFEAGKRVYLSLIKLTNGPQLEALIEALKIVSITMGWGIIKKCM